MASKAETTITARITLFAERPAWVLLRKLWHKLFVERVPHDPGDDAFPF